MMRIWVDATLFKNEIVIKLIRVQVIHVREDIIITPDVLKTHVYIYIYTYWNKIIIISSFTHQHTSQPSLHAHDTQSTQASCKDS